MNGRISIPIKAWKEEQKRVATERLNLCDSYYKLKDETKEVELLRRSADRLMQESEREYKSQQQSHGIY